MTQFLTNRSMKVSVFMALCLIALAIAPACKFNCSMGGAYSKSAVEDVLAEKLKLTSVSCPDLESDPKTGTTFKCTGKDADGVEKQVTVNFTDDSNTFDYKME